MRADLRYAMTEADIAADLGLSKAAVKTILHRALAKIRAHPELCAGFRAAVEEQRRALDERWMRGWRLNEFNDLYLKQEN